MKLNKRQESILKDKSINKLNNICLLLRQINKKQKQIQETFCPLHKSNHNKNLNNQDLKKDKNHKSDID